MATETECRTGKWVFDDADEYGYTYKCTCCKRHIMIASKHSPKPNECTWCGAKMLED